MSLTTTSGINNVGMLLEFLINRDGHIMGMATIARLGATTMLVIWIKFSCSGVLMGRFRADIVSVIRLETGRITPVYRAIITITSPGFASISLV